MIKIVQNLSPDQIKKIIICLCEQLKDIEEELSENELKEKIINLNTDYFIKKFNKNRIKKKLLELNEEKLAESLFNKSDKELDELLGSFLLFPIYSIYSNLLNKC